MTAVTPRVRAPEVAAAGETVTIKTLIRHPMETGLRPDPSTGALVPRHVLTRFHATYAERTVIDIDLGPSVAANPYLEFEMVVRATGVLRLAWIDDRGARHVVERTITVA